MVWLQDRLAKELQIEPFLGGILNRAIVEVKAVYVDRCSQTALQIKQRVLGKPRTLRPADETTGVVSVHCTGSCALPLGGGLVDEC